MKFKKGDIIVLILLFIAALGWFAKDYIWPETENKIAVIEVDGQVYKKLALNKSDSRKEFEIAFPDNKHVHVISESGGIQISDSTCPRQVCVRTGVITKTGQNIVCLPYKVVIYIEGTNKEQEVDDLSY